MYLHRPRSKIGRKLERVSQWSTHWAGSSWAFSLAVLVLLVMGEAFSGLDTGGVDDLLELIRRSLGSRGMGSAPERD